MSSFCADRSAWRAALAFALGCALAWSGIEDASAEPVNDDNELVVGSSAGVMLVPEATTAASRGTTMRVAASVDVFVGLLKRGTSWIDIELALGIGILGFGGDGLVQNAPTGAEGASVLPGAHLRTDLRFLPWADGLAPTALLGLQTSFWAAPAVGSFARIELELGLGLDIARSRSDHVGIEVVYGLPLLDDLPDEPGSPVIDASHRIVTRFGWGF